MAGINEPEPVPLPRPDASKPRRRLALTSDSIDDLMASNHEVLVKPGPSPGSAFTDAEYNGVGARIIGPAGEVWGRADVVPHVKEQVAPEFDRTLRVERRCVEGLLEHGVPAAAHETIRDFQGNLPLLAAISQAARRPAAPGGAEALRSELDGRSMFLDSVWKRVRSSLP
jgi:alanine dehydrogenase